MKDLIEALNIFIKYGGDVYSPFYCLHDELVICGVDATTVSEEDIERLDKLGFFITDDYFTSFRFGSC